MCQLGSVSRATYYRHWIEAEPRHAETVLRSLRQTLSLANRHYGYRRLTELVKRQGWAVNHKRVRRLMREDNLLCLRKRAFVPVTTDSKHSWRVWPNMARGLVTTAINELWVADITYIRLHEEFVYLAVVLDAHSRRVIGWALARHLGAELTLVALKMALAARKPPPGLIHHSDRGVQYCCQDYIDLLALHQLQPSMSRVANPYDHAKAESFMKTLKQEEVDGSAYQDLNDLKEHLQLFLEIIYNECRLHSSLGYQSPVEFESAWASSQVTA